jgi:hypothetical protein
MNSNSLYVLVLAAALVSPSYSVMAQTDEAVASASAQVRSIACVEATRRARMQCTRSGLTANSTAFMCDCTQQPIIPTRMEMEWNCTAMASCRK